MVAFVRRVNDRLAACIIAALASGCGLEGEPRPQLLLVIDTDAPVVTQLLGDDQLSLEASVDTLRVDIFWQPGPQAQSETLAVGDADSWPLSFGVATPAGREGAEIQVWLRLFRASQARTEIIAGAAQLAPPEEATLARLVTLTLPSEGIDRRAIALEMACWGRGVRFAPPRTCRDAGALESHDTSAGAAGEGDAASRVGTSPIARAEPCRAPKVPGRACIQGGFTLLGELALEGTGLTPEEDPVPLRAARLSPFWLDEREVTVGEVRALAPRLPGVAVPLAHDPADDELRLCTWLGLDDGANDALAVNCVTAGTARAVCHARGGALPSEAQWEHAAARRGVGRRFPWGDEAPSCCTANVARVVLCPGEGVAPPGSFPPEACGGTGDVSRDGVLDLGGNVSEIVADVFAPYGQGGWSYAGIATDPVTPSDSDAATLRGAFFGAGPQLALVSLRRFHVGSDDTVGFRCAYRDEAP
jgi:formylglycine-generating enzyme required for sulfatase activity